jgi:hypothetical protein
MKMKFRRFLFVLSIIALFNVALFGTIGIYKLIGPIHTFEYCTVHKTIHKNIVIGAVFLYSVAWLSPIAIPTIIAFVFSCIVHPLLFIFKGSRDEFLFITIKHFFERKAKDFTDWCFDDSEEQNKKIIDKDIEEAYDEIDRFLRRN